MGLELHPLPVRGRRAGLNEAYLTDEETGWIRDLTQMTGLNIVVELDLLSKARDLVPPPKMIVLPGPDRRKDVFEKMRAAFGRQFYLARTGDDLIEIMHPEVNKAVALREICAACGVSLTQSLAIGDGDNDLPDAHGGGNRRADGKRGQPDLVFSRRGGAADVRVAGG